MNNLQLLGILVLEVFLLVGIYWCGRIQERMNWNELIAKGILPKPKKAECDHKFFTFFVDWKTGGSKSECAHCKVIKEVTP